MRQPDVTTVLRLHNSSKMIARVAGICNLLQDDVCLYEPSKPRPLPDWAMKIFSPGMIAAGNIKEEKELTHALSLAQSNMSVYFTLLRREKNNETDITEQEIKDAQNRYAKHQRENPHTPRVMLSLGLPEDDVKEFCTDALFPYVE